MNKALTLHLADLGLIPDITNGTVSSVRSDPEKRIRSDS